MSLPEDIIANDPVLQRVFFDLRRFAPNREPSDVGIWAFDIANLTVKFMKAKSIEQAEQLQKKIRMRWFAIRAQCDGYYADLPANYDDGCEHVVMFERSNHDPAFRISSRRRAALWWKYAGRRAPVGWGTRGA